MLPCERARGLPQPTVCGAVSFCISGEDYRPVHAVLSLLSLGVVGGGSISKFAEHAIFY